jgi:hypothetical protein
MDKEKKKMKCFKCGGEHKVFDCPTASEEEKARTATEWITHQRNERKRPAPSGPTEGSERRKKVSKASSKPSSQYSSSVSSNIIIGEKSRNVTTILDSGSDADACISSSLASYLELPRIGTEDIEMLDGTTVDTWVTTIPMVLIAERIAVRNLRCNVIEGLQHDLIIIGKSVMESLGIDPNRHLNLISQTGCVDLDKVLSNDDEIEDEDDESSLEEAMKDLLQRTKDKLTEAGRPDFDLIPRGVATRGANLRFSKNQKISFA